MAEYIDKSSLIERLKVTPIFHNEELLRQGTIDIVRHRPKADVVEVVHGAWIEENDGTHSCSICGHDATYTYDGTEVLGIVCPYCGAIMDGKGMRNDKL